MQQRADLETKLRAWDKKYFPKMDSTAAADSDQETVPVQPPKKRFPMLSYLGRCMEHIFLLKLKMGYILLISMLLRSGATMNFTGKNWRS